MFETLQKIIGEYGIGRFRLLLAAILLMIGLRPFLDGLIAISLMTDICFVGIMIAGVYALSHEKWPLGIASCLAAVWITVRIARHFVESKGLGFLMDGVTGLFVLQMLVMIVRHIRTTTEVTADLLMGAICGYLMLGLAWAYAYKILELAQQHSFNGSELFGDRMGAYIYYSFVTMTTVGFGEITPATNQARALSILEAVFGQLYLAITIARLVGLHVTQIKDGRYR